MLARYIFTIIVVWFATNITAFTPTAFYDRQMKNHNNNMNTLQNTIHQHTLHDQHITIRNQRKSMTSVQTMSLFGLGGPELVVIGIAVFFFIGPQKLAEIGRNAGRAASDFRDVPKEFQKGLEEGEIEARSRSAKPMEEINDKSESA